MREIWKDVKGYEGLYQVSNLGRVRSLDRTVNSGIKNNSNVLFKGRILKQYQKRNGYLQVTFTVNSKRKYVGVHRLVAETFIPNPDNKSQVNHIDENKTNNNVYNLEWCTPKENCNFGTRNSKIYNITSFRKGHIPWSKGKKIK